MNTNPTTDPIEPSNSEWLSVVKNKVEALSYGIVTIVVHNSCVTQVESTEKLRFEPKNEGSRPAKPKL
jgi:hypothetical protein